MAQKKKVTAKVFRQDEIAVGIYDMWIETELAKDAKPGQFISVYPKNQASRMSWAFSLISSIVSPSTSVVKVTVAVMLIVLTIVVSPYYFIFSLLYHIKLFLSTIIFIFRLLTRRNSLTTRTDCSVLYFLIFSPSRLFANHFSCIRFYS